MFAQQANLQRCSGVPAMMQKRHHAAMPAAAALPRRRLAVAASAQPQAPPQALAFHIGETTLSFPLKAVEAQRLSSALTSVMQTFAEKQAAERPKRWQAMEYVFKGDAAAREIEYLEVFCNPNAHATAFDARALITLRTADGLKVTTEGKLTGVKADVEEYLGRIQ